MPDNIFVHKLRPVRPIRKNMWQDLVKFAAKTKPRMLFIQFLYEF